MRLAGKPGAVSDLTKLDLVLPVAVAPTRAWYMLCACVQQPARGSHISADASAPDGPPPPATSTSPSGRVAMAAKARPVFRGPVEVQVPGLGLAAHGPPWPLLLQLLPGLPLLPRPRREPRAPRRRRRPGGGRRSGRHWGRLRLDAVGAITGLNRGVRLTRCWLSPG